LTKKLDPYSNPVLYDLEYQDYTKDIRYYVELCRHIGGSVLEFGCGNGRLSIPIASAGVELWGVDLSHTMLAHFNQKMQSMHPHLRERIKLKRDDFLTFRPPRPFPLIIVPFNALHHCKGLEQVQRMATNAHLALTANGYMALDCYLIDRELYDRSPHEEYEPRWFIHPETKEEIYSWEQSWWEEEARVHHVTYCYRHPNDKVDRTHLSLHMYERGELRRTIESTGFKLVSQWSDFRSGAMGPKDQKWVTIFQRQQ
jgi:cyclopropane fatty-acyl-phospholipid synthase-like methyltransferase